MAVGINRITLLGNIGSDPMVRITKNEKTYIHFRLATNERQKKNDEWIDHTEWHNIVLWGKRAEYMKTRLKKGTRVLVEGPLRTTKFESQNGEPKWRTEVHAFDVHIMERVSKDPMRDEGIDDPF